MSPLEAPPSPWAATTEQRVEGQQQIQLPIPYPAENRVQDLHGGTEQSGKVNWWWVAILVVIILILIVLLVMHL
jgi:hypothetical protein